MNIGDNIKKYRKEKGLKQSELAEKANVSRVAIGNYERGERTPNVDIIKKIAEALNIPTTTLLDPDLVPIVDDNWNVEGFKDSRGITYKNVDQFINTKASEAKFFPYSAIEILLEYINQYDFYINLNDEIKEYLLEKVCDCLEFELFKLSSQNKTIKQNNFSHQENMESLVRSGMMKKIEIDENLKHLQEENIKLACKVGINKGMHKSKKEGE